MLERTKKTLHVIKKAIVYTFVTFVAVLVSLFLILQSIDPNTYKGLIEKQVYNTTGRHLEINGDLKWKLFSMNPGILIKDVQFENAAWSSEKYMVSVGEMEANISLSELFLRKISINEFNLIEPKLLFEVNKEGRSNWQFEKIEQKALSKDKAETEKTVEEKIEKSPVIIENENDKDAKDDKSSWFRFEVGVVKNFVIQKGNLQFKNYKTGKKDNIQINSLRLKAPTLVSSIELLGDIKYNNLPINFNAKSGSITNVLEGEDFPINAEVHLPNTTVKVNGEIKNVIKLSYIDLSINANSANLKSDLALLKINMPKLPALKLDAHVEGNLDLIKANKFDFDMGSSNVNGTMELGLNGTPSLTADLKSDLIDLTEVFGSDKNSKKDIPNEIPAKKTAKPGELFDKTPLPAKGLNAINYNLKADFKKVKLNSMITLSNLSLKSTLKNGKLNVAPLKFATEQGKAELNLSADASSKKYIAAEASLLADDVKIAKIIQTFIPTNIFSGGSTSVDIYLKGNGGTMDQLMGSLDGKILINNTEPLVGNNIAGSLIGKSFMDVFFNSSKNKDSKFTCLVANLYAINGVIYSNRGVAAEVDNPDINFVIDGTVNLKDEQMDLSLIPRTRDTFKVDLNSIYSLVRIKGNLQDPEILLSGSSALKNTIKETAKILFFSALTGGLGGGLLSQQLFNKVNGDDTPCQTALNSKIDDEYLKDINSRYNQEIDKRSASEMLRDKAKDELNKAKQKLNAEKEKLKNEANQKIEEEKTKVKEEMKKETDKIKDDIKNTIKDKLFGF